MIYFYQLNLLVCNGQPSSGIDLHLYKVSPQKTAFLNITYNGESSIKKEELNCTIRSQTEPLETLVVKVNVVSDSRNGYFSVKPERNVGIVQCSVEQGGKVVKSNEILIRPGTIVFVVKVDQNLSEEKVKENIPHRNKIISLSKLSNETLVFHLEIDEYIKSAAGDDIMLKTWRTYIKEYAKIEMKLLSTRYCPPVPALQIPDKADIEYLPGHDYTFKNLAMKCEGGFFEGVNWNETQLQENLKQFRLLQYTNSTLHTIFDVRKFSSALSENEFIHESELPVLADIFNQFQFNNNSVLTNVETRLNTSNELLANVETKLLKMPLSTGFIQEVLENVVFRVENTSWTKSTGVMIVDFDENLGNVFQNTSSVYRNTSTVDVIKSNPRYIYFIKTILSKRKLINQN